jgi:predicted GIY-YIG superfamily endonuclease
MGTVYLIHFARAYRHARHYLGYADDLDARIKQHRAGRGSRLLQVINQAGIGWDVVRTWEGDRSLERRLKGWHTGVALCPICCKPRRAGRLLTGITSPEGVLCSKA